MEYTKRRSPIAITVPDSTVRGDSGGRDSEGPGSVTGRPARLKRFGEMYGIHAELCCPAGRKLETTPPKFLKVSKNQSTHRYQYEAGRVFVP